MIVVIKRNIPDTQSTNDMHSVNLNFMSSERGWSMRYPEILPESFKFQFLSNSEVKKEI